MNRVCEDTEVGSPEGAQGSWAPIGPGGRPPASMAGFSWDYLDLLDAHGSGLVVIWAFGLPFVPGTVGEGRAGRPVDPRSVPSVCVSTYERGRCTAWCLHVFDSDEVSPPRFGGSTFGGRPGSMRIELDLPVPGAGRLQGFVETEGAPIRLAPSGSSVHRWGPLSIGSGRAELACGGWRFAIEGRAYHDANASALGLESLGIRRWVWGRVPHAGGERIHYVLEPVRSDEAMQALAVDVDLAGAAQVRHTQAVYGPERRGRWGLKGPAWLEVEGRRLHHTRALEDGPFYQRWLLRQDGADAVGVGEVVAVDRMDRGPFGALTQMAVHRGAGSSPWLPLFCGPTRGGFGRLVRAWSGR